MPFARWHISWTRNVREVVVETNSETADQSGNSASKNGEGDLRRLEEQARMRATFVRLVFGDDEERFEAFRREVAGVLPDAASAVIRGSAITGQRWKDGAPFDADGPGTSDIDLTLVGAELLEHFSVDGFWVPGMHSRPLSDEDPDIAPALVPLRERLMALAGRPVNIQATRDVVMAFRGDLLGQPYLTLIGKADPPEG
jgi:hypothetical protein